MGSIGVFVNDTQGEPIGWLGVSSSLEKQHHQDFCDKLAAYLCAFTFEVPE